MKRMILLIFASIMLPAGVFAANDWKGRVVDEKGNPVPFATVAALSKADSTVLTGTITNEDGMFSILTDEKEQLLRVSMIGYKTSYILPSDDITVTLSYDVQNLDEVTITAVIPKVTLTGEGLKTSVHGTALEKSGTAKEMLAKVPGMTQKGDDLEVLGKGTPVIFPSA